MSDRRRPFMSRQWVLAVLLVLGALLLASVMGLELAGFAVMMLLTGAAAFFLRRSTSR